MYKIYNIPFKGNIRVIAEDENEAVYLAEDISAGICELLSMDDKGDIRSWDYDYLNIDEYETEEDEE